MLNLNGVAYSKFSRLTFNGELLCGLLYRSILGWDRRLFRHRQ